MGIFGKIDKRVLILRKDMFYSYEGKAIKYIERTGEFLVLTSKGETLVKQYELKGISANVIDMAIDFILQRNERGIEISQQCINEELRRPTPSKIKLKTYSDAISRRADKIKTALCFLTDKQIYERPY